MSATELESTFPAVDPATGETIAQIPESTSADVSAAVKAAKRVWRERDWRTPAFRAKALGRLADAVQRQAEELADLEAKDTGKPISQARADARVTADYFRYYAGAADKLLGTSIPLGPGLVDYTVREPWGVCAQIIPWNYPMQVLARCAAPALAAGNAVVIKPSELGSVTPLALADLAIQSGLPAGVLNVVTGHAPVGEALVAHEDVDFVTFVGSAAVGRLVAERCARRLSPVQLELGGKSPNVVFADAPVDRAVPAVLKSLIQNAGQSCSAGSRLLIAEEIADVVMTRVIDAMRGVTIGPAREDPDLGPLISQQQLQRAQRMLERAGADGAQIVTGGRVPPGRETGWYLEPTLVAGVAPEMEIFNEEVFGPVLAVTTFADEDEAIRLANATPYGLVAGVWTQDISRAHRVAGEIQAGQVYINGYGVAGGIELPFGGMKRSGYGRGKGVEALNAYTQIKNVCVVL
jgi:aldehyde dehydrogenase (NAD+)/betaine-aldehyde dehydrogenase